MMGTINKVILIGNLGADPEIRSFSNGGRVANLRIATTEVWKDRETRERREKTEWHRIVIFSENLVSFCERYLKKGDKIYVEGALETRKWTDENGQDRYSTEVTVRPFRGEITKLNPSGGRDNGDGERVSGGTSSRAPEMADLDDEIPF